MIAPQLREFRYRENLIFRFCGPAQVWPFSKLRFRKAPVPPKDVSAIVACTGLVSGLPQVEEPWRRYRAEQKDVAGKDIPDCARQLTAS